MDGLEALMSELENSTLASTFWDGEFRISDLRRVYEVVWGVELEPGNFQRKVRKIPSWLKATGRRATGSEGGCPAALFRSVSPDAQRLSSPLRREGT
jgi:8-oxo-dGTP diphosphatase